MRAKLRPLLANVYLHYVYDLWVRQWRQRQSAGDMIVVRYADDTIVGFEHQDFSLTDAGIKAAKDSLRRLDAAKKLLTDMGGEMKQFYMVMGDFDFVGICEAPDDAVMARYVLQLGGLGLVRTKTLKAFPETAYREIIRSLG